MTDTKRTVISHPSIRLLTLHRLILLLGYRKAPAPRRRQASPEAEAPGSKLRVENIHYDLTQDDLEV